MSTVTGGTVIGIPPAPPGASSVGNGGGPPGVPVTPRRLDLDQIQGNIIGFQKDHQTFLFLHFPCERRESVRRWLHSLVPQVSTGAQVLAFNNGFKTLRAQQQGLERTITATWRNIAFTHAGLGALSASGLDGFPAEFKQGMRERAEDILGDRGESAPDKWEFPKDGKPIHALLLLAADDEDDLKAEAGRQITALTAAGIDLLHKQDGKDREDQPSHEHFGFKDGISQPAIADDRVTPPRDGQRPIALGEFVLGYDREESVTAAEGAVLASGAARGNPPDWARNGSYLVFRRLRQNVSGFRDFVREKAEKLEIGPDLMAAKLVGRYYSGAPLAELRCPVSGTNTLPMGNAPPEGVPGEPNDPGRDRDHPALRPEHINDFDYRRDAEGRLVPLAAHIRKVNPRAQEDPGERAVRKHRILRRGIAFGESYREGTRPDSPKGAAPPFPHDRGLLFICYQSSIAEQFEFLQRKWANRPEFPPLEPADPPGDAPVPPGHDPIIGQSAGERMFDMPGSPKDSLNPLPQWVTMTGGDYFFSPSIDALYALREEATEEDTVVSMNDQGTGTIIRPESIAVNGTGVQGSASCSVLITAAVVGLDGKDVGEIKDGVRRVKWQVLVGKQSVWESNGYDDLRVNKQGIGAGVAQVSVRALLRAVVEEEQEATPEPLTVQEILRRTQVRDHEESSNPTDHYYQRLKIKVITNALESITLPVDMGVSGYP